MKIASSCKKLLFTLKHIHILSLIVFFIMMAVCSSVSIAQPSFTQEEIAKLDRYAQIIGQAMACNIDCRTEVNKIGDWLEKRTDEGYPDKFFEFIDGNAMHNYDQKYNSTLTCDEVKAQFYATEFDLP